MADFFALESKLEMLDRKVGDALVAIKAAVDWESFRAELETAFPARREGQAGRPPADSVVMFRVLVLQSMYNLSDDKMEAMLIDRLSFGRFAGLDPDGCAPDSKTIWLYRERLAKAGLAEALFARFRKALDEKGYKASGGQIIDATIVEVPVQRNKREENEQIKSGERPGDWSKAKAAQKDTDARWTKKHDTKYFGYKSHVSVDKDNGLIRSCAVTSAEVHDSQALADVLDHSNTSKDAWMDSAYRTPDCLALLEAGGFREHVQRRAWRNRPLDGREKKGNKTRAKVRARVEHVFGLIKAKAGEAIIRGVGMARAKAKIILRSLTYNITRLAWLQEA